MRVLAPLRASSPTSPDRVRLSGTSTTPSPNALASSMSLAFVSSGHPSAASAARASKAQPRRRPKQPTSTPPPSTTAAAAAAAAAAAGCSFQAVLAGQLPATLPVVADICPEAVCVSSSSSPPPSLHRHRISQPSMDLFLAERLFQDRRSLLLSRPDNRLHRHGAASPAGASPTSGNAAAHHQSGSSSSSSSSEPILVAKFGRSMRPLRLFVASRSSLGMWTHSLSADPAPSFLARHPASHHQPPRLHDEFTHSLLQQTAAPIHHLASNGRDTHVAGCMGDAVLVVHVDTRDAVCLTGHTARVTACEFFDAASNPAGRDWILTISEDRTFKVWDYAEPACIYSSSIVSPSPLTAIAFDTHKPIFVLGSEDGMVRFYDPTSHGPTLRCEPRLLRSLDMDAVVRKWTDARDAGQNASVESGSVDANGVRIVSSLPIWRRPVDQQQQQQSQRTSSGGLPGQIDCDSSVDHALCILSLYYPHMPAGRASQSSVGVLSRLFVACPTLICILDPNSYAVLHIFDYSQPQLSMELFENHSSSSHLDYREGARTSTRSSVSNNKTPSASSLSSETSVSLDALPMAHTVAFAQPTGLWQCVSVAITHALSGQVTLLRIHESSPTATPRPVSHSAASRSWSPSAPVVSGNGLLSDQVRMAVEDNLIGRQWVDNVYNDCMRQLSVMGIHEMSQVPILFESDQRPDGMALPMYVERALRDCIDTDSSGPGSAGSASQRHSAHGSHLSLFGEPDRIVPPNSFLAKAVASKAVAAERAVAKRDQQTMSYSARMHALAVASTIKGSAPGKLVPSSMSVTGSAARPVGTAKNVVMDKPVTFRTKIKSSGYSQGPRVTKMFSGGPSMQKPLKSVSASAASGAGSQWNDYPAEGGLLIEPIARPVISAVPHSSAVTCVRYHPSGRLLGTGGADKCARFYRSGPSATMSASGSSLRDFQGHDGMVTDLVWRTSPIKDLGHIILTTCGDGRARLWGTDRSDPLLVITGRPAPSSTSTAQQRLSIATPKRGSVPLATPAASTSTPGISHARFFYNSQFLVTTTGPRLQMHQYTLQPTDPSTIYQSSSYITSSSSSSSSSSPLSLSRASSSPNRATCILDVTHTDAHTVTAMSTPHSQASRYVVTATSDKRLCLWDMAVGGKIAAEWSDVTSTRGVHWIACWDYHRSPPADADADAGVDFDADSDGCHGGGGGGGPWTPGGVFDNVFASSGLMDGGIKLWDTRIPTGPALQMHGHVNRFMQVRCALSPCGLYVGTGSEDHHAYLYDVRMGLVAGKTRGNHGAPVLEVDFHPGRREMVTACQDGRIRFFSDVS